MSETLHTIYDDSKNVVKQDTYQLRVIALDSKDKNRILVPRGGFKLPLGLVEVGTVIEEAARTSILSQYPIHLPPMTSVARLDDVEGVKGYVIEPAGDTRVELHDHPSSSISVYDSRSILENAGHRPEDYDPIDIDFVRQLVVKSFRRGNR